MSEAEEVLTRVRSLSCRVGGFVRRTVAEQDAFAQDVLSLSRRLTALEEQHKDSKDSKLQDTLRLARGVLHGSGPGGDLRKLTARRNPWLLRFLLGEKVAVLTVRPDYSIALKEDYHAFRSKVSWMVALSPVVLLYGLGQDALYRSWALLGTQVFLVALCYVYISLALRETVLYVNGSHIRGWWITHHWLAMITCLILLSLPVDSPSFSTFSARFLKWSVLQGIVMLVQNRYQRRRMYTRIALGKNSAMDVVTGESSGMKGQLALLYPLLLVLQFWQMAIGLDVALKNVPRFKTGCTWFDVFCESGRGQTGLYGETSPWIDNDVRCESDRGRTGVFVAGALFLYMGCLNFVHTVATLVDKRSRKQR